jgi:hypothetical protein
MSGFRQIKQPQVDINGAPVSANCHEGVVFVVDPDQIRKAVKMWEMGNEMV